MKRAQAVLTGIVAAAFLAVVTVELRAQTPQAPAQPQEKPYEPTVGMPGRDAVWVPTPDETIEKMLDVAGVTPQDFVMDLGSGDGRAIIAAARRGTPGLGVEYNPDLVEYSRRKAEEAGVADKAKFAQGDMYVADISKATVLALFLLPENLRKLTPNFLELPADTRIVVNTFGIPGWEPDERAQVGGDCVSWCDVMLYYVPARVAGTWRLGNATLTLTQDAQEISGTLGTGGQNSTVEGRMRGSTIRFTAGKTEYQGTVRGDTIEGTATTDGRRTPFTATRG